MKKTCVLIAFATLTNIFAVAQANSPAPPPNVFFFQNSNAGTPGPDVVFHKENAGNHKPNFFFAVADDAKVVTGAPYTATATTESTQVLGDGNRIVNKTSAFLARDGQGRTRREETMDGPAPDGAEPPRMAFIHDPVAKSTYILDLNKETGHVISMASGKGGVHIESFSDGKATGNRTIVTTDDRPIEMQAPLLPPPPGGGRANIEAGLEKHIMITDGTEGGVEQRVWMMNNDSAQVKTESLGKQVIEGVTAEGTRTTRTIPAGQIGNERPIEITSEVWTSPELKETVLSKHNDPRFGETVYRLTNIQRGEPAHSLFTVPENFTVNNAPHHKGEL